jgi:hypothetical protein
MLAAINVDTVNVENANPVFMLMVLTAMVDAIREEPVSVENLSRTKEGTIMEEAYSVETIRVELKNPVFAVMVLMAMVDAIRDDPVSVEN